ncbi:long-chain fatty alcohol dehydrogenase [Microthyrium microscopicum]|uniref:Long-chain fatty alcohol dehydrogenase n=1 Tax=Microthyrium microscopicum TaxID=703497 RepID=A0A6A6U337_9PEZI|nr:long-chain fatty alcohol dehydrogenase [Microthyrium microscopicum]
MSAPEDTYPPGPYTPKPSPLHPAPSKDPLSKDQWRTFYALADTIVACIQPSSLAKPQVDYGVAENDYAMAFNKAEKFALAVGESRLAKEYMIERPSDNPLFRANAYRLLSSYVPKDLFDQLVLGLTLLNYRITGVFLTRRLGLFADQPVHIREEIVQSWSQSPLPIIRLLFKSLGLLVKQTWAKSSAPLHKMISFPRVPVHGTPAKGFEFSFIELPPGSQPEIIETDVVVVGSGCGGGVVAKNLAEAGHKVLVVDKAYHFSAEHFPMVESEGWVHLFHNGGFLFSKDSSTCVVAGQAWGGGGAVNWSASLQTQGYVRKEWSDAGLPFFTSYEFQHCLDSVCDRMGVSGDHITQNKNNDVLLEGARRLGWTAKVVPQNSGGKRHYCGYCTMGCAACEKQGPSVSFLPDAAQAGAKFIEGFDVDRVLFETDSKTGKKTAVGVQGSWLGRDEHGGVAGERRTKRKVIIKAKRVIISAGTMHTPTILMRSRLTNKHIGSNLKLHPVCVVGSVYDEEVRPWEGGILTAVVSNYENLDGKGHGVKLEATSMLPSTWLAFPVWRGSVDWKMLALNMKHMTGHISLARDEGSGSVYLDAHDGRPRFKYNPSRKDRRHILEGVIALAKLNYIAGAREIFTAIPGVPHFVRAPKPTTGEQEGCDASGINCPTFNAWLDKIRKVGLPDPDTTFFSAHQMGSCRMGASPKKGALDMYGRTWEADNLYVADASTFPSASGVNPMITNMAISEWVARNIVKDMKMGGKVKGKL